MSGTARDAAFAALYACRKSGEFSDSALKDAVDSAKLDTRDAALASRICYGVLQNKMLLDFYLEKFCSRSLKKLEPALPDILRIAAYQMLFMDKVPDTAAVNEAVKMAKKRASLRGAGLVNGVLRALAAAKNDLPDIPAEDKIKYLSVKYSHPEWMIRRFYGILGEEAEEFLACNNGETPTVCRVNRVKCSVEDVVNSFRENGVECETVPWLEDSVAVLGGDIRKTDAFKKGWIFVQDPAATLSVMAACAEKGMNVLDVCSSPGGKSFACASFLKGECRITSRDVNENKVNVIRSGAKRLGMDEIITAEVGDGSVRRAEDKDKYDLVIVDAPCSGLGIIRKKPDVRYKTEEEISGLPEIQRSILFAAADAVKSGGTLMYSTCTVLPEENEGVVNAFLSMKDEFYVESFSLPGKIGNVESGMLTLWPQKYDTDGFFICRMRRK